MYANSFSVFTLRSKYMSQLPLLIRQHHTFYPGWEFVLYTDAEFTNETPYVPVLNDLNKLGLIKIKVVNGPNLCDQPLLCVGMLWRMRPIWEGYSGVFCRDLDSILTPRQAKFVTAFIRSGHAIHAINDNEQHSIPLMGGMVGFKADQFKSITGINSFDQFISMTGYSRNTWQVKGSDQDALMSIIWPRVRGHTLLHKPHGPNDRCQMKDCCPGIELDHVHPEIRQWGDTLTNYIGASNCNNTTYGEKTISHMIDMFDKYGNQNISQVIKETEKKHSIIWT